MIGYILRRFGQALIVVFIVTVITFSIIRAMPGDPVKMQLGPYGAKSEEQIQAVRKDLGLDKPLVFQYFYWVKNIAQGDWGVSYKSEKPVLNIIWGRIPSSAELILVAIIMGIIISIPLATGAAANQSSVADNLIKGFASLGMAVPAFWLGLILINFFSIRLNILPPGGYADFIAKPAQNMELLILPGATLAAFEVANFTRFVRSDMVEVLDKDFIRTARAKGLPSSIVYLKHVFKNTTLTLITVVALEMGTLISNTVLVEQVFGWSGLGWLIFHAFKTRDYPLIQGLVLFTSVAFVFINLVADLLYASVDPRVRLEE